MSAGAQRVTADKLDVSAAKGKGVHQGKKPHTQSKRLGKGPKVAGSSLCYWITRKTQRKWRWIT